MVYLETLLWMELNLASKVFPRRTWRSSLHAQTILSFGTSIRQSNTRCVAGPTLILFPYTRSSTRWFANYNQLQGSSSRLLEPEVCPEELFVNVISRNFRERLKKDSFRGQDVRVRWLLFCGWSIQNTPLRMFSGDRAIVNIEESLTASVETSGHLQVSLFGMTHCDCKSHISLTACALYTTVKVPAVDFTKLCLAYRINLRT